MEFEDFDDVEDEIDEEQQDQREQVPPSPRADQPHSQNRRRTPRKAPSKKPFSNDRDEMIAAFHSIIQKQERERLREKAEAMYERTFKRRDRRRDEAYYRRRSSSPHRSSDADDYMSDYMSGDDGASRKSPQTMSIPLRHPPLAKTYPLIDLDKNQNSDEENPLNNLN
eukprot:Seg4081.4 transcript_id=Seg4081.4/GoldUCD/mRNA.D3Y31 product="hypothetical protein" protein_id=Seg4081.4/GoldUCD/D3Y31